MILRRSGSGRGVRAREDQDHSDPILHRTAQALDEVEGTVLQVGRPSRGRQVDNGDALSPSAHGGREPGAGECRLEWTVFPGWTEQDWIAGVEGDERIVGGDPS